MNQKSIKNGAGFVYIAPIIFLIIGVIIGASITFGVIQYKDKIVASVSNILKKTEIVVTDIDSVSEDKSHEEIELPKEPEKPPTTEAEPKPAPKPKPKPQPQPPPPPPAPEPVPQPEPSYDESSKDRPVFEPTPGLYPDLAIQSVTYYPSAPIEGNNMAFYATVKNQGEGSANVSIANLSIDEINIKQVTASILTSNKAETLIWNEAWAAIKGEHKLKICLDADSKISESNEGNNCFESVFDVSKTQLLADYIIRSPLITPSSPVAGDMLSFSAEVYNQGNASGTGSSSTRLRIDLNNDGIWDIITKDTYTDLLDAGEKQREHWDNVCAATQGTHKYEICTDALSNINEPNENNNCTSKTFTVP